MPSGSPGAPFPPRLALSSAAHPRASQPMAPGPRARRLRETYAHALQRTLAAAFSPSALAACFPTLAARAAPLLAQVRAQMVDKLADKCEREFDSICAARQVVARLNALEALVADAGERRSSAQDGGADVEPTPLHLLPPAAVLAAHVAAALAPHQSLLNARLQTLQAQNSLLAHHVCAQRAALDALLARLDAAVADLHAANVALAPVAAQLADDARTAPPVAMP